MSEIPWKSIWRQVHKKKNVVGISGELQPRIKESTGEVYEDELCVRIYVEKKEPERKLSKRDLIPKSVSSVPVDVVVIGKIQAPPPTTKKQSVKDKFRPAPAGCSAIHAGGTACTLGWFARDKTDGELVVIANNHCTADENTNRKGHPYLQPSPYDGGRPGDKLGVLKRFVPIKFYRYTCRYRDTFTLKPLRAWLADVGMLDMPMNRVDLGIISVPEDSIIVEVLGVGKLQGKRRGTPGELAEKVGRTTGHTIDGKLIDNNWYGHVSYARGKAFFGHCGLIEKKNFSAGGDSSSAIFWKSDKKFAGLLFAGSTTHTIFCHWDDIEAEGNVEIVW